MPITRPCRAHIPKRGPSPIVPHVLVPCMMPQSVVSRDFPLFPPQFVNSRPCVCLTAQRTNEPGKLTASANHLRSASSRLFGSKSLARIEIRRWRTCHHPQTAGDPGGLMQLGSCAWSGKATSVGEAVGMQAPSATIRDTLHPQQESGGLG